MYLAENSESVILYSVSSIIQAECEREEKKKLKSDISFCVPASVLPSAVVIKVLFRTCLHNDNIIYCWNASLISCNKNVKLSRNVLQGRERKKRKKDPVFSETEKEESSREETTHYSVRRRDESNLELPRELCHVRLQEGVSLACHSRRLKILRLLSSGASRIRSQVTASTGQRLKKGSPAHRAKRERRRGDLSLRFLPPADLA